MDKFGMKSGSDVIGYLKEKGFSVKKSALYNHIKSGKLQKRDGIFYADDVERYATFNLKRVNEGTDKPEPVIIKREPNPVEDTLDNVEQLQLDKLVADTKKAQAQAEHWETKTRILTGEYIEVDLFNKELAARASLFKNDIGNFIKSKASQMIKMSDGDLSRTADIINFWELNIDDLLSSYSEPKEFEVKGTDDN